MAKKLSKPEKLSKAETLSLVRRKGQSLAKLPQINLFTVLMVLFLILFVYLQAILWIGDGSLADVWRLKKAIAELKEENKQLSERNQKLINEVEALRSGTELIENHAREDLGLVKENEIFYHVIDDDGATKNEK